MLTVRDPIWDTIRLDPIAVRILDSPAFQRLRYIRQLGLAHLVYPGANHTRFDHALGVYHLARRALDILGQQDGLDDVDPAERRLVPLAALLHDIGHYAFSHAVEELDAARIPGDHETIAARFLAAGDIAAALAEVGDDAAARVHALIQGRSPGPLQGLVSGSLDLDKIEYLLRDARFCGVPYGEVDVDRLLHALALLRDPETGVPEVGVHEKGVASLESLLFAKYQMFRNVYWHHAVRAATVMYKRIVDDAVAEGLLAPEELVGHTDEALLALLEARAGAATAPRARRVGAWVAALRVRRLPKRAAEIPAADVGGDVVPTEGGPGDWLGRDTPLKRRLEDRLARELGLEAGTVFLDFPEKRAMFGLHLLVRRRSGEVLRLGPGGRAGLIGLPRVADELYRSARVLRLFTYGARATMEPGRLVRLVALPVQELQALLDADAPLP